MTAKERAESLFLAHYVVIKSSALGLLNDKHNRNLAKQNALVSVDEIYKHLRDIASVTMQKLPVATVTYWDSVKEEIEKIADEQKSK